MRESILVAPQVGIADVDAEALQEALVALHAHDRLAGVDVDETDLGVCGSVAHLAPRPTGRSDRPASKLSVANVMSTASAGSVAVSSAMTTTPSLARSLDCRHDAGVRRGEQDGGGAARDGVLDTGRLTLGIGVERAPACLQVSAQLLGLGRGAVDHPDPEGIDVLLDDEVDLDAGAIKRHRLVGSHGLLGSHGLVLCHGGRPGKCASGQCHGRSKDG